MTRQLIRSSLGSALTLAAAAATADTPITGCTARSGCATDGESARSACAWGGAATGASRFAATRGRVLVPLGLTAALVMGRRARDADPR